MAMYRMNASVQRSKGRILVETVHVGVEVSGSSARVTIWPGSVRRLLKETYLWAQILDLTLGSTKWPSGTDSRQAASTGRGAGLSPGSSGMSEKSSSVGPSAGVTGTPGGL